MRARGAGRRSRPERTPPTKSDKADADEGKKTRTPSKEIKIEQMRGAARLLSASARTAAGCAWSLLYPAEALNVAASNALLKTLEEPPAGVVFLLVSARIDRLLPTIISRCRQWPMTLPAPGAGVEWLAAQGVAEAPALLAEAGGAPLTALALASDENRALRDWTLAQLAAGPELRRLRVRRRPAEAARAAGARLAAALAVRFARAAHGGRATLLSRSVDGARRAARRRPMPARSPATCATSRASARWKTIR